MRQAAWEDLFKGAPPSEIKEEKPPWWTHLAVLSWEDWLTLAIVLILFMTVVQSIDTAGWTPEMPSLYPIAFLGLGLGLALAKTPVNEVIAHTLALIAGIAGVVFSASSGLNGSLADRSSELFDRMHLWINALFNGGISNDNLPFVLMIVALTYLTAYISAWSIFRWYNAWVGLIPAGLALLTNISYLPGQKSFSLLIFLFGSILLVSRMHVLRNARAWRRTRTAYPDLISLYVLNVTVWIAVGLLAVAWILPIGNGSGFLFDAWDKLTSPVTSQLQGLDRVFSSINSKKGATIHKFGSTLPLQGEISLGGGEVMQVGTTEPVFLRAQTYDFYTAQGWKASASQITTSNWPALKALQSPEEARRQFRRPISVEVTTTKQASVIVSAGQPLSVNIDSRVVFGPDPSDVTSIRPPSRLNEHTAYRVDGTVSAASPGRLRQAPTTYPAWLNAYRQLPDNLPGRVKAKAREVARDADNPYDKAVQIEQFLRTYAVDTKITPAPAGRDSVDYFLFDAGRGYFDYHATAMVVMLRSLGIPARISVGYVVRPQDRIPDSNIYSIAEGNAFAWPEVYFPGLGWVEFNPTPSEPRINRPGSDDQMLSTDDQTPFPDENLIPDDLFPSTVPASGAIDQLAAEEGSHLISNIIFGVILAFLGVTIVGGGLFQFAWQRGLGGLDYPSQIWEKTQRLATWARIPSLPQETPAEYAARLGEELPDIEDSGYLGAAFVRSRYGHKELSPNDKERLTAVWKEVRNRLFARVFRWK